MLKDFVVHPFSGQLSLCNGSLVKLRSEKIAMHHGNKTSEFAIRTKAGDSLFWEEKHFLDIVSATSHSTYCVIVFVKEDSFPELNDCDYNFVPKALT